MREQIGTRKLPDSELRELLTTLIKQCSKSRVQVAQEMSVHAGQPISKHMLDDWTSESKKPARFPAAFITAFCDVTGSDELALSVMGVRLRGVVELRDEQTAYLAESLRAQVLKPRRKSRATAQRSKQERRR